MIELMKLPYAQDALEPAISKETISYHYGKHHKGYVDNLNNLIEETGYADMKLEDIIREAGQDFPRDSQGRELGTQYCPGRGSPLFVNAAQVYNHNLYWESLRPEEPVGAGMSEAAESYIKEFWGSVDRLKTVITTQATKLFGSGWIWICKHEDNSPFVRATHDAGTPLDDPLVTPLLVIDVWEHAYYLQYKNDRAKYIEQLWPVINWDKLA